jgi:hypothetical protein
MIIFQLASCTHPPSPVDFVDPASGILLQAKEGGVIWFAPLCEAERGWGEFK